MAPFHIETEVLVLQFAMLKQFSGCIKNFRQDIKVGSGSVFRFWAGPGLILILNTATSVITLLL